MEIPKQLEDKIRVAFLESFVNNLEGEYVDFKEMGYGDLLVIIDQADVETLEEISEDILDNKKLKFDEKMSLWSKIDERLRRMIGNA